MNNQIINLLQDIKIELKNNKNNTWMDIKKVDHHFISVNGKESGKQGEIEMQ